MEYINPRTIGEIVSLAHSMYEFKIFEGVKDACCRILQSCLLTVRLLKIPDMRPTTIYFRNWVSKDDVIKDIKKLGYGITSKKIIDSLPIDSRIKSVVQQ